MSVVEGTSLEYVSIIKNFLTEKYRSTTDSLEKGRLSMGYELTKDCVCDHTIPYPSYSYDTVVDVIYLIKNDDNQIISFVLLNRETDEAPWILYFIYTDPNYRKMGHAARLLSYVKERHGKMLAFIDGDASENLFSKFYVLNPGDGQFLPNVTYSS